MTATPAFVSVVIPTRDRGTLLDDCLASLRRQDYPQGAFEIIAVDDGSTDSTPDVVRRFQDGSPPVVRYVRQAPSGPNAARNAGIRVAQGDPICFVDDDVEAPPAWLRELVEGVARHPEAGALGGRIRVRFEGRPPRLCGREPWVGEAEFDLGEEDRMVPEVISANMAIRLWAVRTVGLFDETFPIYGDELEWQRRLAALGHPIVYVPAAILWHRRTAADLARARLLKRYLRRGANSVAFARRVGEPVTARRALVKLVLSLAHAARRRCFLGILMMAQQVGVLSGLARERCRRLGR